MSCSDSLRRLWFIAVSENHKVLKFRNLRNCVNNDGFFPSLQSAVMLVSKQPPVRDPIMGIRSKDRDVFVMVNYDFEYITEDGKEIWMKEGEILLLLSKTNGDWWQVNLLIFYPGSSKRLKSQILLELPPPPSPHLNELSHTTTKNSLESNPNLLVLV